MVSFAVKTAMISFLALALSLPGRAQNYDCQTLLNQPPDPSAWGEDLDGEVTAYTMTINPDLKSPASYQDGKTLTSCQMEIDSTHSEKSKVKYSISEKLYLHDVIELTPSDHYLTIYAPGHVQRTRSTDKPAGTTTDENSIEIRVDKKDSDNSGNIEKARQYMWCAAKVCRAPNFQR